MLNNYRNKVGATRFVLLYGLIYVISQAAIAAIIQPLNPLLFLKAQITFSKDVYLSILQGWARSGLIMRYFQHFYLDFFHPIFYGVFLSAFMAKAMNLNKMSERWNLMLLVPFIAGVMDVIENCFHLRFLTDVNTITRTKVFMSAFASNTKWALAGISLLIALVLFLKYLVSPKKGKS